MEEASDRMTDNAILRRIGRDQVALGLIVRMVRSGEIARLARATDHDFLFIDGQHAAFSRETVAGLIAAALGCGVAPLVRPRRWDDPDASLFLDAGAAGVIVPDLSDAGQARAVVRACRFPPRGARSLPGPLVHDDFRPVPADAAMPRADAATVVVGMIETPEGLANVEEIAAVDGLDVLHVGCVDLLLAMGKPDRHGCPEILDAIAKVAAAARRHGKILGVGGDRDPARRARYIREGVRFMTTETDIGLLLKAAGAAVEQIRAMPV